MDKKDFKIARLRAEIAGIRESMTDLEKQTLDISQMKTSDIFWLKTNHKSLAAKLKSKCRSLDKLLTEQLELGFK